MSEQRIHPFEIAGLGKAPFQCVGYEYRTFQACQGAPTQVGGSCDYCGQGICHMYFIQSSDGKRFKVGSNCVEKTSSKGSKILTEMQQLKKKHDRQVKEERTALERNNLETALGNQEIRDRLAKLPHPVIFMANNGKTFLDYAEYVLPFAGLPLLKVILSKINE